MDIQSGDFIEFQDDPMRWGIITVFSDCGTGVYYKFRGITYGGFVDLSQVIPHPTKPRLWQIVS